MNGTVGVEKVVSGKYERTGKGNNKTVGFVLTSSFNAGEEIVFQAYVTDIDSNRDVSGAIVEFSVTYGFQTETVLSAPSDSYGIAVVRWTASAARGKKNQNPGIPAGDYTVTVTNVTASGYQWDGTLMSTSFTIE